MLQQPELLAPAGSLETLKYAAVNPGASDDDKAVQKLCQDFLSGLF